MVKTAEKYSVLMSVYKNDNPEWLKIAIDCMLNQTTKPSDFVIVEDGPLPKKLDNTVNNYKTKHPKLFNIIKLEKNLGLGPALKIGVENCKNEFIARMDADDLCFPDRIEKQFAIFDKNKNLGLVGSNVEEFEGDIKNIISHVILPETHAEIEKFSKSRCPFRHPSLLYRKSAILKAGNYREFYLCEDYDLYVRLLKTDCKCYNIQEPLTYMRIGKDFYKRRGGIKYLKSIMKFKTEQLKTGYFSFSDYIKSSAPHVVVCLLPNSARDYIYRNFLRRKAK